MFPRVVGKRNFNSSNPAHEDLTYLSSCFLGLHAPSNCFSRMSRALFITCFRPTKLLTHTTCCPLTFLYLYAV
jgi:hypothetical protein